MTEITEYCLSSSISALESFGLSLYTVNLLEKNGITAIKHLVNVEAEQLLVIPYFASKQLAELKISLARFFGDKPTLKDDSYYWDSEE